jgi:hypothetical protein
MSIMPTTHHEWFIHTENLRNFEKKLQAETDPDKRQVLLKLLAEERSRRLTPKSATSQPSKTSN